MNEKIYNYHTLNMIKIVRDLNTEDLKKIFNCSVQYVQDMATGRKSFNKKRQMELEKILIPLKTTQFLLAYEFELRKTDQYTEKEKYTLMLKETLFKIYPQLETQYHFFSQTIDVMVPFLIRCYDMLSLDQEQKRKIHSKVIKSIRIYLGLDHLTMSKAFGISRQFMYENEWGRRCMYKIKLNTGLDQLGLSCETYNLLLAYHYLLIQSKKYNDLEIYLSLLTFLINIEDDQKNRKESVSCEKQLKMV